MMQIKKCSTEYIDRIYEIDKTSSSYNWTKKMFVDGQKGLFDVLFIDDIIAGFIVYSMVIDEGEIFNIVIDNKYKEHGYGTFLLQNTLKKMSQNGVKTVYLEVGEKNNKAIQLYKKLGFDIYNRREKYYKNGENAILMKKTF